MEIYYCLLQIQSMACSVDFLLQPFQQVEQAFLETVYAFLYIIYGFADVVLRGLLTVLDRIGICEGSFSGFYGSFGE